MLDRSDEYVGFASISEEGLRFLIESYTHDRRGVRSLKREIGTLLSKKLPRMLLLKSWKERSS